MINQFSIDKTFRMAKNCSYPVLHDLHQAYAVWRFLRTEKSVSILNNDPLRSQFSQSQLIQQCLCTVLQREGNCVFVAYATLSREQSKRGIGLFFIFSCQSGKIKSRMKFSFWNQIDFCWFGQAIFCDCFYVFANWDAVYKFEGKGTFWSRVHSGVNSECYFWSLVQLKTLNK